MRAGLVVLALVVAPAPAARGQAPNEPIKMTLRPAAAPSPALKYRLLPELGDTQPGNAALLYLRSLSPEWWTNLRQQKYYPDTSEWLDLPFKKMPPDAGFVRDFTALREVELGARREHCDWELTGRIRTEGIGLLLPDVQGFREIGTLLALRSRFEIADRDHGKALHTLQTGVAFGRHVGEAPTMIHGLVGIAIINTMLGRVEELIQAPESPNLYWALTSLPRLVDLHKALEGEKMMLDSMLPELKTLEKEPLEPVAAQKLLKKVQGLDSLGMLSRGPEHSWRSKMGFLGVALKVYPQAKRSLIAQGRKPEEVEAMPVLQVILIDAGQAHRRLRDDFFKWTHVPLWQAQAGWKRFDREVVALVKKQPSGALFLPLLPAIENVYAATVRLERRIAALRTIEAIRLHAAAHGGELPAKLGDITAVPVPDDPATGKSFLYRVDGNRVTLRNPPGANGRPALPTPLYYELTFKR